jgi:hypothetical protein
MGKQYNKVIKRRRRAAYVAKKKAAIKELVGKSGKATKSKVAKPKAVRKPAAKKEKVVEAKPDPVAEKAKPVDVLGPDDAVEAESATKEKAPDKPQQESAGSVES